MGHFQWATVKLPGSSCGFWTDFLGHGGAWPEYGARGEWWRGRGQDVHRWGMVHQSFGVVNHPKPSPKSPKFGVFKSSPNARFMNYWVYNINEGFFIYTHKDSHYKRDDQIHHHVLTHTSSETSVLLVYDISKNKGSTPVLSCFVTRVLALSTRVPALACSALTQRCACCELELLSPCMCWSGWRVIMGWGVEATVLCGAEQQRGRYRN